MKYLAAFLLLGLATATTESNRKNITIYGVPSAGQYYGASHAQARPAGRPLQVRDVFDRPVMVLANDTESQAPGALKACVLAEGLASLPGSECGRQLQRQLLQAPGQPQALLFDAYDAEITRFSKFRNYTVNSFVLPNNTKVSGLARILSSGLPSLLVCQDEYCAEGIRQAYVKKIAKASLSESSFEVIKSYEPTTLLHVVGGSSSGPSVVYVYPASPSAAYPPAAYSPGYYPGYYPQAHNAPSAYGLVYPQGYSPQGLPFPAHGGPQYDRLSDWFLAKA